MKQTLTEICLRVQDREATIDFYCDLFDFEVAVDRKFPEYKFDLIYLNSPNSNVQIELTYNYDSEPYDIGNGFSHLGVVVDDLDAMHKKCLDSKYETTELKALSDGSVNYFFVTDPDGYRIEVKDKQN